MIENLLSGISIDPQVTVLVPVLWVLGYALKRTPHIPDWLIIWILLLVGVGASGWTLGFDFNGIANGFIATGAAITTHQSVKQTFFARVNDRNKREKKK
ncbi:MULTISPECIES: phage holin family protein [Bacillaceae]|uniref:phage holin family protein n=1 Tax=Bacillaceae TaxID=186817 RepID=UPI001C59DCC5|nr:MULTISPECIES: phage holin family protein [Rossellomorea]MBW3114453.1 phage holin family protein [Bacillus sp. MCCB 382]MDX8344427.1 phage holin family protein [Rossellomorea sp. YZS02]